MKRIFVVITGLAAVGAIAFGLFGESIGRALFERAVAANVGRDATAGLADGLHVALCGTGSPMADPTRAGPCTAVIAGRRLFVVDMGSGAARTFGAMGLPIGSVEALLLTHFHSDHIDGIGELMTLRWATGSRRTPLPVYGPTGVAAVVDGFNAAYVPDRGYRIAHHGAAVVPPTGHGLVARAFDAAGQVVVLDDGDLKVTAFPVDHRPVSPAVGYRFDYRGRSVVLSGDTAADTRVAVAAKGADLLIHEALNPAMVAAMGTALRAAGRDANAKVMADIPSYHASPSDAARIAAAAGVDMLVLTHIVPPLPTRLIQPYFLGDARRRFGGEVIVGRDGMLFSLPAGSDAISRSKLD